MKFGPNASKLTILRRSPDADGTLTGPFKPAFDPWCDWTQNPGRLADVSGQREDPVDLIVRVNDCEKNRTITNNDRAVLKGEAYEIVSVGLRERRAGSIPLTLARASNG